MTNKNTENFEKLVEEEIASFITKFIANNQRKLGEAPLM